MCILQRAGTLEAMVMREWRRGKRVEMGREVGPGERQEEEQRPPCHPLRPSQHTPSCAEFAVPPSEWQNPTPALGHLVLVFALPP